jgi:hypothetical protein
MLSRNVIGRSSLQLRATAWNETKLLRPVQTLRGSEQGPHPDATSTPFMGFAQLTGWMLVAANASATASSVQETKRPTQILTE